MTGAERAPDQPLDLLRAARLLAGRSLAPRALGGGARQHAVFRRHPALAAALQPWRHRLPTLAVHSTWVPPKRTRQEPSAWHEMPRSRLMGRKASAARLDGRMLSPLKPAIEAREARRTLEDACAPSNGWKGGFAAVDD